MHIVTMKKVSGGERIRTDQVIGTCVDYPEIGKSFELISESLAFKDGARLITTSLVRTISKQDDNSLIIETENSTYQLIIAE